MNREEKQGLVNSIPQWWHSIDLGDGVVTPGFKTLQIEHAEVAAMRLPDLTGKSVLDIGALDGFFSFEAERRGASRVVALEYESWRLRNRLGVMTKPGQPITGFEAAAYALGSKVGPMHVDFMQTPLEQIGTYDVTFFLGVLYHLTDPLRGMQRVGLVTKDLAVIETTAIYVPNYEHLELFEFYEADELNGDGSNWFAPNLSALQGMARASGFKTVIPTSAYPPPNDHKKEVRYRLTVQAWH